MSAAVEFPAVVPATVPAPRLGELPRGPGAYAWWYLDALSPDGRDGLVVIFFAGYVFSPHYAARLRAGVPARPEEHAAVHAALYRGGRRVAWLLAEREGVSLSEGGRALTVGNSSFRVLPSGAYAVHIDDRSPLRVCGEVTVEPLEAPLAPGPVALCPGVAGHTWFPAVPRARVRARFERPGFVFEGEGYHDRNAGDEPMERALSHWSWARTHGPRGSEVLYDVRARNGARFSHRLGSGRAPAVTEIHAGESFRTGWGIDVPQALEAPGGLRMEAGALIESTPFYARYAVRGPGGARGVGESLDLLRFDQGLVRWMLRWKTWRHGGYGHSAERAAP